MQPHDLGAVVSAHLEAFPAGFFALLGPRFLTCYYRTFLYGPMAVARVAEVDGRVCGYLVGILDPVRHRQALLANHGLRLAFRGAAGLVRRPRLALLFLRTRVGRYARSVLRSSAGATTQPSRLAVLSHVVVEREWRGQGIGGVLVSDFLGRALSTGCSSACLVTIAGDEGAGTFYEYAGWVKTGIRPTADGRLLAHYTLPLEA